MLCIVFFAMTLLNVFILIYSDFFLNGIDADRLFFTNSQQSLFSEADNQFWSKLGKLTEASILSQKLMVVGEWPICQFLCYILITLCYILITQQKWGVGVIVVLDVLIVSLHPSTNTQHTTMVLVIHMHLIGLSCNTIIIIAPINTHTGM